ncbi:MAG: efflux RND transporter periplasmic adaptor subunit [Bacteroidales bacterium]|nr:efflux RND transporter periplasmic adaptor subunit [Bacteroidales bacterium]
MKKSIKLVLLATSVLLVGTALTLNSCKKNKAEFNFETAMVSKGDLSNSVSATGTLEAIQTVDVGTQVSGVILHLYADFNTVVKKGQLLAELDKTPLLASLQEAKASVADAKAELEYQEATFNRIKALFDKKLVAQTDYDQALYNYNKAKANIISVQAKYERADINLKYATISSPIDGVVLNRAVEEGQTVAASFNTPTLFSIANDLTQMEVQANIDEADIGKVKQDQRVEFTVDAYPEEIFQGSVSQVRIEPVITSNVVTYTVIINAPNPDKKLMPGMTATITVFTDEMQGALTIPGKALRFTPDAQLLAAYNSTLSANANSPDNALAGNKSSSQVWVKDGSKIHPVQVVTGMDNGTSIEIKSGLKEGDVVVLSMSQSVAVGNGAKAQTAKSPFMPTPPGQKKK